MFAELPDEVPDVIEQLVEQALAERLAQPEQRIAEARNGQHRNNTPRCGPVS
jgi:hypothetical protein